jgi:alpha-2-macroglobulin
MIIERSVPFILICFLGVTFLLFNFSCGQKEVSHTELDPDFSPYLTSYSGGVLSKEDRVIISFADYVVSQGNVGEEISSDRFRFVPAVKAKARWTDRQTIEFFPENNWESGKKYLLEFKIGEFLDMPDHLQTLSFSFDIIKQAFEVGQGSLRLESNEDLTNMVFHSTISTADVAEAEELNRIVSAKQETRNLEVIWTSHSSRTQHKLEIRGIQRKLEESSNLQISWDGSSLGVPESWTQNFNIPSLSDFSLLEVEVFKEPETYILATFSDPINPGQELIGMVSLNGSDDLRLIVEGQELFVYPNMEIKGEAQLEIHSQLKNQAGYVLGKTVKRTLHFEELLPAVKMISTGTITPISGRLTIPFETVNLRAVDVGIIRLFEKNIHQHLQQGSFEASHNINRVGELVLYKTIRLDNKEKFNPSTWQSWELDVSDLVTLEPGAIYHTMMMFKPSYSTYDCPSADVDFENLDPINVDLTTNFDRASTEFFRESGRWAMDWRERDNPCSPSYFNNQRWERGNLLATDLGLTAKIGTNSKLFAAVNDLNTTRPISNVRIKLYSYAGKLIQSGRTGLDGTLRLKLERDAFLLVASSGTQKNYLKLQPNESLSVSRFEVGGSLVRQGLKGFIYGERDVWRPGDSLFISFILEDKNKDLPSNHPITFQVRDPNGVVRQTHQLNESVGSIYHLPLKIPSNAKTGRWSLQAEVGNVSFHSPLRIETIIPNRLRADLDFGAKELTNEHFKEGGLLSASWLHGAPASGLNADVNMRLSSGKTTFTAHSGFIFDDPSREVSTLVNQSIFSGKLNADGMATVRPDVDIGQQVPGMLNASFNIRVFEAGGNFSTEIVSYPFHPFNTYVGIKPPEGDSRYGILTNDKEHTVDLVAVNPDGKMQTNTEVDVNLYKLEWRWWWDRTEDTQGTFTSNLQHNHVTGEKVNLSNGKGSWTFSVPHPEWGRYLLRVCDARGEHCSGEIIYIDWPGWASRGDRGADAGASMLSFFVEEEEYAPGENMKITIPSPENGRALVSVENGTEVLETHWVETVAGNTHFELKAKKEWAPNVYIHISLLQPHASTENNRPIRMYGIVPVKIVDPNTHLQPQIAVSGNYSPEEKATFSISEKSGKPMAYTVAVVDEGLLNITRYRTPDPWNHFYSKEALGVRSWDVYDDVAGAIGANWGSLLAVGGDAEIKSPEEDKANRFKPVVKYFGPFELTAGKKATHEFKMPNYIGSVRIMAVAAKDGAYGSTEKDVVVKKPLMVLATLPRVLGPGEEVDLAVSVFAMEESVRNVELTLETNDLFEIVGEKTQKITFDRTGEQLVFFRVKTKMATGIGKIAVSASSGPERAHDQIEIDVRNPNQEIASVTNKTLEGNREITLEYTPLGEAETNYLALEVSSIPPLNLSKRLHYLMSYPHGCLEQRVSAVFPQLYLSSLLELSSTERARIQRNVNEGINSVRSMQLSNGGISYWPGVSEINDWAALYAGHFMIEAKNAGYQVPSSFLNSWTQYVNRLVRGSRDLNRAEQLTQSYALYLLALNGSAQLGAMNRMRSLGESLDNMALWHLAAAYHLVGRRDAAEELLQMATQNISAYRELSRTFGSDLRDQAIMLRFMLQMDKNEDVGALARLISTELSKDQWLSTQETAFALLAMSRLATEYGSQEYMDFSFEIEGENNTRINTDSRIWQYNWVPQSSDKGSISLKNNSDQLLFVQLVNRGTPLRDVGSPSSSNIVMEVRYLNMLGEVVNPSGLSQGTDFIAEIKVRNPGTRGDYRELVLSTVFPSSWEILNERLTGDLHNLTSSTADHRDIRDDRIYTYFGLNAGETRIFHTLLNASYAGNTFLPPFVVEAMYDNSIQANTAGREIEVLRRK